MRAFATPPAYEVPAVGNLTDPVVAHERERPEHVAFVRQGADRWDDVTSATFAAEVRAVAAGLAAAGVEPGDRVALLSRTRYEWTVFDYAIWWAGATTVPVYETSSASQVAWILQDSGAVACVVETRAHARRVADVRDDLPGLRHVWGIDDNAVHTLTSLGADLDPATVEDRRAAVGPASVATIVYTSGTTGRPKGCALTHGNLMFETEVVVDALADLFDDDASTLLFLPLAHVFARVIQVVAVRTGTRLGHTADVSDLLPSLEAFRPTFVLAVPRVFEKVFTGASQRAHGDGRGGVFDRAAEAAIAFSRAQDEGRVRASLRARHAVFDRLVYRRLRAALGGRTRYAVSGGAPLGDRLAHFFRGIGIPVLEGYGLTETTAALTVNLPDATRIGTVGRPLPGTSVSVADDGELLFRGGQVFSGYWHDDEATATVLEDDGWFHSGDMGEIDESGFVRITGRKKEILVTAGGKNVAPAVMEDIIRAHPLVSQCMVVGDGKPFIAALVTLDADGVVAWAERRSLPTDLALLSEDPALLAEVQKAVDEANAAVSRAESIRKFRVLPVDWTEEAGQVTPTLKLRRDVVMRDFHHDVEDLFG